MNRFERLWSRLFRSSSLSGDNTSSNISGDPGHIVSCTGPMTADELNLLRKLIFTSSTPTDLPAGYRLTPDGFLMALPRTSLSETTSSASSSTKPGPSAVRRPGDPVPHELFLEIARTFGSLP